MKKETLSIGELIKAAEKEKSMCDITFLNEPDFKLMAEAAINLYQQTH